MRTFLSVRVAYALLVILPVMESRGDEQSQTQDPPESTVTQQTTKLPEAARTQPCIEREFRTFRLKHADAQEISDMGQAVFRDMAASEGGIPPGWFPEPRTNTLVVTASKGQFQVIEALIAKLDVPGSENPAYNRPYVTRMQLVIFETLAQRDRLANLEVAKLTANAGTCQSMLEALGEFGKTAIRYRADQIVELESEAELSLGAKVPFTSGRSQSKSGVESASVSYEAIGCTINLWGHWNLLEPERGKVKMRLELAGLSDSTIDLGEDLFAPVFRDIDQEFHAPITAGEPIVFLTVDASDSGDTAVAHVFWMVFERTQ